jgi:hypothetical protein
MAVEPFWEYGGDFPWPEPSEVKRLLRKPGEETFFSKGVLFGTGRTALLALLAHGRATRGWRRLWAPSYFCPRVMETIEAAGWECPRYIDTPVSDPTGLPSARNSGDVVLRMNFFGWRGEEAISGSEHLGCDVIEDHSHDPCGPWSRGSRAAYCVASLRKTMPVPDGGWLWSPVGQSLPNPGLPTEEHLRSAELKITGMTLKQHYRAGIPLAKSVFREFLLRGEALLGAGAVGGIHPHSASMLGCLSPDRIAERRRENFATFCKRAPLLQKFSPEKQTASKNTPFSLVLIFDTQCERERVRTGLMRRCIYPSLVWSLPNAEDPVTVDFGNRSLTLSCHYFYGERDLERVAEALRSLF